MRHSIREMPDPAENAARQKEQVGDGMVRLNQDLFNVESNHQKPTCCHDKNPLSMRRLVCNLFEKPLLLRHLRLFGRSHCQPRRPFQRHLWSLEPWETLIRNRTTIRRSPATRLRWMFFFFFFSPDDHNSIPSLDFILRFQREEFLFCSMFFNSASTGFNELE